MTVFSRLIAPSKAGGFNAAQLRDTNVSSFLRTVLTSLGSLDDEDEVLVPEREILSILKRFSLFRVLATMELAR